MSFGGAAEVVLNGNLASMRDPICRDACTDSGTLPATNQFKD
jgi:hypothetical protein